MLFNTYEFILLFLPVTLGVFFYLGKQGKQELCLAWLVAASFFYYGYWNPKYLVLIGFSILFNYCISILLMNYRQSERDKLAGRLLFVGVAVNLGLIAYYKYANFFINTVNDMTGSSWVLENIILPVGISFFTFQQIAYLVDSRREGNSERNFLRYSLFVVFFPQLVAGPIVHHKQMLPQFARASTYHPQLTHLAIGGTIFIIGLFKKVVIADNMALLANPVFAAAASGESMDAISAWTGTFAYSMQLYFDFSGYSDMAIGIARMFGIRLPLNFNSPYQATSIIDFWRRWHLTLSTFLRDYVYFSLGGNRKGRVRRYINLAATMIIGGLWHGAGWTFIFWGTLHGLYLVINHAWRAIHTRPINTWWSIMGARLFTFLFVAIAWVFFRAEDFQSALIILDGMRNLPANFATDLGPLGSFLQILGFRFEGPIADLGVLSMLAWAVFWFAVIWYVPNTQQFMANYAPAHKQTRVRLEIPAQMRRWKVLFWRPLTGWAVFSALLFTAAFLSLAQVSEFLYYQF